MKEENSWRATFAVLCVNVVFFPLGKLPTFRNTLFHLPSSFNRLTPNDPYMGRTAPLTSKRCILYIYSTNIGTEYFKDALYSPFFFCTKCSLFHNANLFGSCIIHILYTGCAEIKKKNNSGAKGLNELWRWNRQSVPKRRHIKFRRRGITHMKECNNKRAVNSGTWTDRLARQQPASPALHTTQYKPQWRTARNSYCATQLSARTDKETPYQSTSSQKCVFVVLCVYCSFYFRCRTAG